jgi:hypothetical protein
MVHNGAQHVGEIGTRIRRHATSAPGARAVCLAVFVAAVVALSVSGSLDPEGAVRLGSTSGAIASVPTRAPLRLAACQRPATSKAIEGAPSRSLLSILAVLRRPATRADALPAGAEQYLLRVHQVGGRDILVRYVRRARVISGTTYWVYPEITDICGHLLEETADWASSGSGGGMGDAATIERGQVGAARGSYAHTVVQMLIPDGVRLVVLHYPAGRVGGFDRHLASATSITTRVVGNFMVVTIPRRGKRLVAPMTMTWVGTGARTVETFNRL